MGVYVKGLEMPKVCADCPFREIRYETGCYYYEHCSALNRIFNESKLDIDPYKERLDDCPLIEIADTEWEYGQREAMKKLADIVLAERKTDEAK